MINKYNTPMIEFVRKELYEPVVTMNNNLTQSFCKILDCYFAPYYDNEAHAITKEEVEEFEDMIESLYVYAICWSFGTTTDLEGRRKFDNKIREVMKGFTGLPPATGLVFDYCYDIKEKAWVNWLETVPSFQIDTKEDYTDIVVPTFDSIRMKYLKRLLISNKKHILCPGNTGTGKTINIEELLTKEMPDEYQSLVITFSAQTSANQTQDALDEKFEKRARGVFGPAPGKRFIIFVDDLNMPKKEFYGAQPPIELLRQFLDQGGWYDLKDNKHPFRNIIDTMLICSMGPPGGGKTFITPRMQRHFNIVAFTDIDEGTMTHIFKTILGWWFSTNGFNSEVARMDDKIVAGTMKVYNNIQADLKPTPAKSHYTFNLRDFSKVICGICLVEKSKCTTVDTVIRLWAHETMRVFGDRLINDEDRMWMLESLKDTVRAPFSASFDTTFRHLDIDGDGKIDKLDEIRGLLFGDLLVPYGLTERPYEEIMDIEKCIECCNEALAQYNIMTDKPMNLVLFRFAVEHLIRISRIMKQPGSHALLVGVGGSGRQSLTRLASRIADFKVSQIEIKKQYGMNEWRENVKEILRECGGKGDITTFLFTDSQIKEEGFLEDINNILNTGEIPNLFPADEKADVCELVRPTAKAENKCPDGTPAQLFSFFVEKCRKNLHIVLCFSPIGEALRNRIINFPSLVNCTTIDWFSEWPADALDSVANKFLGEVEMPSAVREQCAHMVKFFHTTTVDSSVKFLNNLKRHYYVTPTSFLEMIYTFKELLKSKREEVLGLKERYENHHKVVILDDALIAATELSNRYITDRQLPDKAIDLIDEAAAKLRMEMDSLPGELDELDRKVRQLEIEREAIKRENDKEKLAQLNEQIANLSEALNARKAQWQSEKEIVDTINKAKQKIEDYKIEAEAAERNADFAKVAEIRYGKIKEQEAILHVAEEKLHNLSDEKRLTDEEVDSDNIAEVVANWTGIPVNKMLQSERDKLLKLEEQLHERLIGQDEAVRAVADAVRRSRAGLADENKPIGSFIFLGPTGVGKTELAKALAEILFNDEKAITRIDMSEFQERHSVSRLVGAPPGYVGYDEGGELTEAVRRKPYSIVLLDEIEKAHPDTFNILLQVLDDGRLTDNKGRVANFKNTIIIMTSNMSANIILENFEDLDEVRPEHRQDIIDTTKAEVFESLKEMLRPEFLNRIDEQIMFTPLSRKEIRQILLLLLKGVDKMLAKQDLYMELTDNAIDLLADLGYDPQFGARPMKRVLQREIINQLSKELLSGRFAKGDTIVGDEIQGNLFFRNKKDIKKVEDLVEEVDVDENTDSTD
jgi:ATP-dependent protease Clp ATPase subunit